MTFTGFRLGFAIDEVMPGGASAAIVVSSTTFIDIMLSEMSRAFSPARLRKTGEMNVSPFDLPVAALTTCTAHRWMPSCHRESRHH